MSKKTFNICEKLEKINKKQKKNATKRKKILKKTKRKKPEQRNEQREGWNGSVLEEAAVRWGGGGTRWDWYWGAW